MTTDIEIAPDVIKFSGGSVKVLLDSPEDHIQRHIKQTKEFYEIDLLGELFHRALPGMQFIDVGANIGNHSLFLSGIVGLKGYAFEPSRDNYHRLSRNIDINKLSDKVIAINAAVGAENGYAELISSGNNNTGQAKFVKSASGVEMVSLDNMTFERVDFLKIDVEGYEVKVIEGAARTIELHRPLLICEASSYEEYYEVKNLLNSLSYVPTRRYCVTPTYLFEYAG